MYWIQMIKKIPSEENLLSQILCDVCNLSEGLLCILVLRNTYYFLL